ncbi:MAG: peptide deformylase [Planctomycetaceae bacterium]|nr:peptide deformylase [Planctomycetaceae bacterium]
MQIVHYPHPALRWKSKPIVAIDAALRNVVDEMFKLMYSTKGIGLAANQVALPYRLFVVNVTGESDEKDQEFVFINPEIVRKKGSEEGEEGCLSIPDLYLPVRRAEQIVVRAFDLTGEEFEMKLDELPARVIQHEYDHLDGVLFTDRVSNEAKLEAAPVLADFEARFRKAQSALEIPPDAELKRRLEELEPRQKTA